MIDQLVIFLTVCSVSCIIGGFIGLTNNPISRYMMRDFDKEKQKESI